MKRKICLVSNRFPPKIVGGAELTVENLAIGFYNEGHDVFVYTLSDDNIGYNYDYLSIKNIRSSANRNIYNQFNAKNNGKLLKIIFNIVDAINIAAAFDFFKYLNSTKPDIVITHNIKGMGAAIWIASKLMNIPIIHVLHDYWLLCGKSTMYNSAAQNNCSKRCMECRFISKPKMFFANIFVEKFVGVSEFLLTRHGEFSGKFRKNGVVIHNSRRRFDMVEGGYSCVGVKSDNNLFTIGYLGRIDSTKGVGDVFEMMRVLGDGYKLIIAGSDVEGLMEYYKHKYADINFEYLGFVDPVDFYKKIAVSIVPSLWDEPFGNVAFEGWQFGVPSIVYRSGGLPEVLAGMDDFVVDRGDFRGLAKIVEKLSNNFEYYSRVSYECTERRAYYLPERQINGFMENIEEVLLNK